MCRRILSGVFLRRVHLHLCEVTRPFPNCRPAFYRANGDIKRQSGNQRLEPPRVVHVENVENLEQTVCKSTESPHVRNRVGILGNKGADYRVAARRISTTTVSLTDAKSSQRESSRLSLCRLRFISVVSWVIDLFFIMAFFVMPDQLIHALVLAGHGQRIYFQFGHEHHRHKKKIDVCRPGRHSTEQTGHRSINENLSRLRTEVF